jgi:hypothetical protein
MEHATGASGGRAQNVDNSALRTRMKSAHRHLLIGSKEENGLARSSSLAMLRGKQIETRSARRWVIARTA